MPDAIPFHPNLKEFDGNDHFVKMDKIEYDSHIDETIKYKMAAATILNFEKPMPFVN